MADNLKQWVVNCLCDVHNELEIELHEKQAANKQSTQELITVHFRFLT